MVSPIKHFLYHILLYYLSGNRFFIPWASSHIICYCTPDPGWDRPHIWRHKLYAFTVLGFGVSSALVWYSYSSCAESAVWSNACAVRQCCCWGEYTSVAVLKCWLLRRDVRDVARGETTRRWLKMAAQVHSTTHHTTYWQNECDHS